VNSESASPAFPEVVRNEVAKILSSQQFAQAGRLSRFLKFTVTETLAGHADDLKEYAIGTAVFDRRESFDPRTDSIVRVQAVALRARLKKYYATDGVNDPIIIEYKKGSYAPVLRYRSDDDRPAKPTTASPASIAVLPFVNMSSDPENEYFSDGLTEELISALSNVKGMRVVARTSVFQYKGKSEDVRKIGAELSAHMVLEGSVRKSGDRLRITVQLIEVANGYHSWSRTYRVEMKDLFTVQEEIARAIVATLGEGSRGPTGRHTGNLDAYHNYLKGRFHLNKWTEDGFRKSIEFFEAAIDKDPEMAAAWAGVSDARFFLACYGQMAPRELMPKARMAAEKATALDPSLAEAHVSLGAVRALYDWDWLGSEEQFCRAIELDPDCAQAYQWLGVLCLLPQGRVKEAETAIRRALDLDPLSPGIGTSLGLAYFVQGRDDEAIACFAKALETDPNFYLAHWWLGARVGGRPAIFLQRSLLLKGFAQFRRAGALSKRDWSDPTKLIYGHELAGKRSKARRMLDELTRISDKQYFSPVLIAAIHVALGEADAAFKWLEKACLARDPWLAWLSVDRRFDSLRQDSRFRAVLKKIGIVISASLTVN
jgi:TolB-like protein/tetratricopeptide (TPR) repeat protein